MGVPAALAGSSAVGAAAAVAGGDTCAPSPGELELDGYWTATRAAGRAPKTPPLHKGVNEDFGKDLDNERSFFVCMCVHRFFFNTELLIKIAPKFAVFPHDCVSRSLNLMHVAHFFWCLYSILSKPSLVIVT